MSQELSTPASNIPSPKTDASPLPAPEIKPVESFSGAAYYGVPFDELLDVDISKMTDADRKALLNGIISARKNPGHKKVEKSTAVRTKGKGSDTKDILKGLI